MSSDWLNGKETIRMREEVKKRHSKASFPRNLSQVKRPINKLTQVNQFNQSGQTKACLELQKVDTRPTVQMDCLSLYCHSKQCYQCRI